MLTCNGRITRILIRPILMPTHRVVRACVIKLKFSFDADLIDKSGEMFCPFSSGAPPRASVPPQTEQQQPHQQQQQPLNLKHLSEAVRTLTSPPVSTSVICNNDIHTCSHVRVSTV